MLIRRWMLSTTGLAAWRASIPVPLQDVTIKRTTTSPTSLTKTFMSIWTLASQKSSPLRSSRCFQRRAAPERRRWRPRWRSRWVRSSSTLTRRLRPAVGAIEGDLVVGLDAAPAVPRAMAGREIQPGRPRIPNGRACPRPRSEAVRRYPASTRAVRSPAGVGCPASFAPAYARRVFGLTEASTRNPRKAFNRNGVNLVELNRIVVIERSGEQAGGGFLGGVAMFGTAMLNSLGDQFADDRRLSTDVECGGRTGPVRC